MYQQLNCKKPKPKKGIATTLQYHPRIQVHTHYVLYPYHSINTLYSILLAFK